jgi:hypothetical protein
MLAPVPALDGDASLRDVVEILHGIGRILQVMDARLAEIHAILQEDDGED